jgi:hypothetical protein
MKFNIDDYKGKYVMHCKTDEEADNFLNYLDSIGKKWCSGRSYLSNNCWNCYTINTVYNFNNDSYCNIDQAKRYGYKILEWSDFMNKKFTKADLKTGDVVKKRNGEVEIVIKEFDVLLKPKEWNRLEDINNDLTHSFLGDGDIIAVRRPIIPSDCQFSAFKEERGILVYERKEVEEMTLAEVCKLLGKEIKIVK